MSDRLKQVAERFTDIKQDLGLSEVPDDMPARLSAVVEWLDQGITDPAVAVRATQVLLLDPELPGARKRPAVKATLKALGGAWMGGGADGQLHLLQAAMLAARPEKAAGHLGLTGLMGAGWEVMRGRGEFREASTEWRSGVVGTVATRTPSLSTPLSTNFARAIMEANSSTDHGGKKAAIAAMGELRTGAGNGWQYNSYSDRFLVILDSIDTRLRRLTLNNEQLTMRLNQVTPQLDQLRAWRQQGIAFNSYASHLIGWMDGVVHVLTVLAAHLLNFSTSFNVLRQNINTGWNFDGLSQYLFPVLDALLFAVSELEDRQRLDATIESVHNTLQQQSTQVQSTLTSFANQLPAALASARPDEVELLWWGQARYCHTLFTPFRKLLKDPAQRIRACYAAIAEVSDRAWRLAPEPSAAYLVEVLAGFGFDVDERRSIHSWMEELAKHAPPDAPQGPIAALAKDDAAGLPVTWARLHPQFQDDSDAVSQAVAMPVDAQIDLGTWATWILHERLLERRARA